MRLMSGKSGLMVAQLVLAMLVLLAVVFTPPAEGRMLLVPLDGDPVDMVAVASTMATPFRPGPLPGSLIVDGKRHLVTRLWADRILVLAAPAAICASE